MLADLNFEKIFKKIDKLPTVPAIAIKILETIKDENKNLSDLVQIITLDISISTEILRLVNSPRYALPNKINSLPLAINILGPNTVKYTALSFSIARGFKKIPGNKFNYVNLWKESILTAVACRVIADGTAPEIKDDMFAIGLLHDIGRLIMWENLPTEYQLVLTEQDCISEDNASLLCLHDIETKILGVNHAYIGATLIKNWGFPSKVHDAIEYHHCPNLLPSGVSEETKIRVTILSLASLLKDYFTLKNKKKILEDIECYVDSSGFIKKEQLDDIKSYIDEESKLLFPLFEVDYDETDDYFTEIFKTARDELIKITDDIIDELSEQQKIINNLIVHANYDELTSLYNYRRFYEAYNLEFTRIKRYSSQGALIFIDIDFFKKVNDNYGHMAGDLVLKSVANTLLSSLRETDIVCRYGGEEFAVILPETDCASAVQTAERLREAVENLKTIYEGHLIKVTISLGVKSLDSKNLNADSHTYVRSVDKALYRAKELGRNRVVVAED